MKKALCAALAAVLLCSCGRAPELKAVQAAAEAAGGKDKILALNSLIIEGAGENPNLGQNFTPDAPLTVWKVTEFKRVIDVKNGRMRLQQTRTAQFPFALANIVHQDMSVDGDIAWDGTDNGNADRLTEQESRERRLELLRHPVTILRAALDPAAKLSNFTQTDSLQTLDITTARGDVLKLELDRSTHLPLSVTSTTDQPNLGDVAVRTAFTGYEDVNGLKVPKHLETTIDKWVQSDIDVSKNTIDADVGNLGASAGLAAELPAPASPPLEVSVEQVVPGIWWLAGTGNHHSVVFEFADHLTIFELPESEARAKAVIAKARSLRFGKPLTEVIVSHHHFDHSAGLRLAVAEGLTIITQSGNGAFFKDLVARKHTIVPDELSHAVAVPPMKIRAVDDQLVLKDSALEVQLFHVKDNSHCDTLLMAWVPRDSILVQADLYDSGWLTQPWAANLRKNVELRKLKVAKDVPIHGKIEDFADVLKNLAEKQ